MTNGTKLRGIIEAKGIKLVWLAKELNISRESLYLKLENENQFKQNEIFKICELLDLSLTQMQDIFFNNQVD